MASSKMTTLALLVTLFIFSLANEIFAQPIPRQFSKMLFDGAILDGWQEYSQFETPSLDAFHNPATQSSWAIDSQAICCPRHSRNVLAYRSQRLPSEFELTFRWKCRGQKRREPWNSKKHSRSGELLVEYNAFATTIAQFDEQPAILRTGQSAFSFRLGSGSLQIATDYIPIDANAQDRQSTGLSFPPVVDTSIRNGKWNQGRIVWREDVVEHWVNDEKVVDFDMTRFRNSTITAHKALARQLSTLGKNGYYVMLSDEEQVGDLKFRAIELTVRKRGASSRTPAEERARSAAD